MNVSPFGWKGSEMSRLKTRSWLGWNETADRPAEQDRLRESDRRGLRVHLRHVAGDRVLASQPENDGDVRSMALAGLRERAVQVDANTIDRVRKDRASGNSTRNRWAARQGPIVWELDGPTPILKMSNVLIGSMRLVRGAPEGQGHSRRIRDRSKRKAVSEEC